jgi:uncharacterized protein YdhG (YjbR/CyaY superfamily)
MNKSVDSYLYSFLGKEKEVLEELRQIINLVSDFEETLYYGMPAFRYKGKYVACFRMYAHHIGFYPCSGKTLKNFPAEIKRFKTSVGAVQFPKGKKLPKIFIIKIIKARMKEIDNETK